MTKLIGIISYLPDDINLRKTRYNCFITLINTCNYLFNLPIYVIIQNYTQDEIDKLTSKKNVKVSKNFNRLGILGARRELRKYFLESPYDNLIMLDDDCALTGGAEAASKYLQQIDENPNCFIEFNGTLLKLFSISKELFAQVDYEDINPENGDGFEDIIFVSKLRNHFKDRQRTFIKNGLEEFSISSKDEFSTWYKNQNIEKMRENTNKMKKQC